jgi:hypothetical protein
MDANLQQWAGKMSANTETIATVILTSDGSPSDLRILNDLLISVRCHAEAMKRHLENKHESQ